MRPSTYFLQAKHFETLYNVGGMIQPGAQKTVEAFVHDCNDVSLCQTPAVPSMLVDPFDLVFT